MISRIKLLRNIGKFHNVSPPPGADLAPFSLLYAENGRGKTTLAAIFRSLATDNPELINERQRLSSMEAPHIVLECDGNQIVFQDGEWLQSAPDIAIFDDAFVSANVCSGIELQSAHRQNLHELILGAQGVSLNAELQTYLQRIGEHNAKLSDSKNKIPKNILGNYSLDDFCDLKEASDIDAKIKDAEQRVTAAKAADAIHKQPIFVGIDLPNFDTKEINALLKKSISDLESAATEQVRTHVKNLGDGGEAWVADGMSRIELVSEGKEQEVCPFCAQNLADFSLISYYRAYFSKQYNALRDEIKETGIAVRNAHAGDVPAAFERAVRTAIQTREFWKDFVSLPSIEIDTASIIHEWNKAREAVLEPLRAKMAEPLKPIILSQEAVDAVEKYRLRMEEVASLSKQLLHENARLADVKEQVATDEIKILVDDLTKLKARKARFDSAVAPYCDAYLQEKSEKEHTEKLRDETRKKLDQYREEIFPKYEDFVNKYLIEFGASFRLGKMKSNNTKSGSYASYYIVIDGENVDMISDSGPSFRNTLSSGDRNTLALAFFFASLERDPNLTDKTVIIDDPMTSLDDHRASRTRSEIARLMERVQQVIVLSHSKRFLCALWEQTNKNGAKPLRINRAESSSEFAIWDVREDSFSEHDKNHEQVRNYLQVANPKEERQVAGALRPILEAFMRVAAPEHFLPGCLLGPFIELCKQRLQNGNEILTKEDTEELKNLLDYANKFHHDTNPAWETESINDAELEDFCRRVLRFTSRR